MHNFCIFCKTFRRDLARASRLLDSIERYNTDAIPVVLCVPRADRDLFIDTLGKDRATLIHDEDLVGNRLALTGWRGQQVVKLHFARAGVAQYAVFVDADFTFIRPFYLADFLTPDGEPWLIVSRRFHAFRPGDDELAAYLLGTGSLDPVLPEDCARFRSGSPPKRLPFRQRFRDRFTKPDIETRLRRIHRLFGHTDPPLHFMPGPVIATATLKAMEETWLRPAGFTFAQLILTAPFEYNWVGDYALTTGCQPIHPAEPRFLHFASAEAVDDARSRGITREHIARLYLGVAMAATYHDVEDYL